MKCANRSRKPQARPPLTLCWLAPAWRWDFGLDTSGLALLLDTAGAIAAINGAVGHPGGAFDRILNTIEKVAAKKPVAETQKQAAENKSPKRKAEKKAGAKRVTVRRKPLRRAPQKRGG